MTYEIVPGGHVTSPAGFKAGSVNCGIKQEKEDLVILFSEAPTEAAAKFTQNQAAAAPVQISRRVFRMNRVRAVLINSGNANACTGEKGLSDALLTQAKSAEALGLSADQVALASTGCIGVLLPIDNLLKGICAAASTLSADLGSRAAAAIMTSDTEKKEIAVKTIIDGKTVTIGGMAKGSGMINPSMATMLGFVTTDAAVDPDFLNQLVTDVVNDTFNMITVDGDASTNDTVMVLANGRANNCLIDQNHPEHRKFSEAFFAVCKTLAISIVKDGEGATKLIEIATTGFANEENARKAAKAVLNSNRLKTSIFAEDGYWGRIISSLGNSGVEFRVADLTLELANSQGLVVKLLDRGRPMEYKEEQVASLLKDTHIIITINASSGSASARGWGCDLSYDYVKISGFYRNRS